MNICRTCLKTPADKRILELENVIKDGNKNSFHIMLFCLDIEVIEDSKITTNLCNNCYRKIISFYKFKALSLKNDAYLKSLEPAVQLEDQKLSVYVDENGIKHENFLDPDDFGPSLVDTEYKIEVEIEEDKTLGDTEIHVKNEDTLHDAESDKEPLSVVQKVKYENFKNVYKENGKKYITIYICGCCVEVLHQFISTVLGKQSLKIAALVNFMCSIFKTKLPKTKLNFGKTETLKTVYKVNKNLTNYIAKFISAAMVPHASYDIYTLCDLLLLCVFLLFHFCLAAVHKKRRRPKKVKLPKKGKVKQECQVCEECGKSVRNLKGHTLLHQRKGERQMIQCKLCPKLFTTDSGRHKHYRNIHLGLSNVSKSLCDICNKEVKYLKGHIRLMHNRESLPYVCVSCDRRFTCRSVLEKHKAKHVGVPELPYKCDICKKRFRNKNLVSKHIRQFHLNEKNYQCEICSKTFFEKRPFIIHMESHSKEPLYKCNDCGLALKTRETLRRHRLLHRNDKEFPCELCSKTFRQLANLRIHMVTHTKEKRFECRYCGVRFGRSHHRSRHEFTAHQKQLKDE